MQKCAHLAELEKCCQTHIFLQNFVLIQPRTSPPKICKILQKIANFEFVREPLGDRREEGSIRGLAVVGAAEVTSLGTRCSGVMPEMVEAYFRCTWVGCTEARKVPLVPPFAGR